MNKHQRGSILLFAWIILSVIASLSVFSLEATQLAFKMTHHDLSKTQLFYFAERGLKLVESQVLNHTIGDCLSENKTTGHSFNWWHTSRNCQFTQDAYTLSYRVEHLHDESCVQFDDKEVIEGARYYRIIINAQEDRQELILQSLIAVPIKNSELCTLKKIKILHLGRQSWIIK